MFDNGQLIVAYFLKKKIQFFFEIIYFEQLFLFQRCELKINLLAPVCHRF